MQDTSIKQKKTYIMPNQSNRLLELTISFSKFLLILKLYHVKKEVWLFYKDYKKHSKQIGIVNLNLMRPFGHEQEFPIQYISQCERLEFPFQKNREKNIWV